MQRITKRVIYIFWIIVSMYFEHSNFTEFVIELTQLGFT